MADTSLSACLAEIKENQGRFYVYILSRPDGMPFYVGCGRARGRGFQRIAFHESETRNGGNSHKCNTIRLIWSGGGKVNYRIDGWYSSEAEMFRREVELIARIGRADMSLGPLTNWSDGGDGIVNRTEAMNEKARASMALRVTAEFREMNSRRIKAHWDSEEGRAKRIVSNLRPDTQKRRSESMRRLSADPDFIKMRSAASLRLWSSEDYVERQGAALRAAVSTKEHREKKSIESKTRWSDPEYRERLRAAHRARWKLLKSK